MAQGYVRRDGNWVQITAAGERSSGSWIGQDGYVRHNGEWLQFTGGAAIEDFEGISSYDEVFRGTFTGNAVITSDAAIATDRGSTQGMRCWGFVEMYSLPGDHDPPLEAGRDALFYFKPIDFDSSDQWHFVLAPQSGLADEPPDYGYRFEFHMNEGSRIVRKDGDGTRKILATENDTNWHSTTYTCEFNADFDGIEMSVAGTTLTTSDTTYIDDVMGFGYRASGGGTVDYDWFGYI